MAANTYLKAVISATDKLSPVLKGINRAMRSTKKAVSEIGNAGAQLRSTIAGVVAPRGAVVGLGAAASFGGLVGKVVQTSAQFEKFQTILETIEGSSEKARASMNWVSDFATKTPYELQEVTDSFVKLKAYGIDPQAGALKAAGDAAAAMGKPLEQAVEALADAMTGENERLKEFGIKSAKVGDKIVYTWNENGKTMAAKVSASNKAMIQSTLQGSRNRRDGGAMDKLAGTWDGMLSNLKDGVARFMLSIGDAGLFGFLKTELGGLLEKLNTMANDGSLKALATTISNELVTAFKELKSWAEPVDWKGVWQDIKDVASGIKTLVESIGGIKVSPSHSVPSWPSISWRRSTRLSARWRGLD
jgi:phage tail tape-measure protein